MVDFTGTNPLLTTIKATIEGVILPTQLSANKSAMTDDQRQEILKVLLTFSDDIPHPASGLKRADGEAYQSGGDKDTNSNNLLSNTLIRWQILAYVAGIDLTIAKWFESHLDALSILQEVGYDTEAEGLWAVWAAEGHPDPIRYEQGETGAISDTKVSGTKAWCSGANIVDYGLMTYRDQNGQSQLLIVDMHQLGIDIDNSSWQAVGMQATDTATIRFDQVQATPVGAANAYLDRVGFWHGAAGVAACWYGATASIAAYLVKAYQLKPHDYKVMYLGQIAPALALTRQYFYHLAELIDTKPEDSHELAIRQLRANVEQVARLVLETVGLALGAAPFCLDAHFSRLCADLNVFIRQSHGAFDNQRIGELISESADDCLSTQDSLWQL